jgi:hypothetical protein
MENEVTTLASLSRMYADIEHELLANEGELTKEIETRLNNLVLNISTKVDSIAYVLERLDREAEALKARAKMFQSAAKRIQSAQDWLKQYTKVSMQAMSVNELQGQSYRFLLSNSKPKLVVSDEQSIPPEFWTETVTRSLDRDLIEMAIANGIDVPGVHYEEVKALRVSVPKGVK